MWYIFTFIIRLETGGRSVFLYIFFCTQFFLLKAGFLYTCLYTFLIEFFMTRKVYNTGVQTRLITTLTEVVNKSYFIEYFFSLEKVNRKSHVTIFVEARLLANLF